MMQRLIRSRGFRKFTRDRIALVALAVILVYLVVALAVWFGGLISVDSTRERVLPNLHPGIGATGSIEDRTKFALWYVERIEKQLERAEQRGTPARSLLDELTLAERRVADKSPEEFKELIERAWEVFEGRIEGVSDQETVKPALVELETIAAEMFPKPTGRDGVAYWFRTFLGSDSQGSSISLKTFYSVKVAFQVGLVTSVISVILGTLLGTAAAFLGGWVDAAVMWVVATLSSIPYLVMLAVLAVVFRNSIFDQAASPFLQLVPVYAAFCLTFWVGTCRVIRGEVLKIKELEYVQAAKAIGFGQFYIMLKHVIPNTAHLMFINFSLLFIGAIKSEVILSFLGLGVRGQPSWGIMIAHGKDDVQNFFFWQVLSATVAMFGLVLSFNVLSDALQDAFDPKHVD